MRNPIGMDLGVCYLDKMLHLLEYAVLGILLARAIGFSAPAMPRGRLVLTVFIIGTFYGFSDEFHQYFTPGRSVSFFDLMADSLGSFLGALIFTLYFGRNRGPVKA